MPRQLPLLDEHAAHWSLLDERLRGTRFFEIAARGVLNSPASTGMPFWSVNPYVGCEFGCTYCYARDTHRYAVERAASSDALPDSLAPLAPAESFERNILVKSNAPALLARALATRALGDAGLLIGSATDPYQPAERRFRLTRSLLEVLLGFRGVRLEIITKSPLITRDLPLLVRLATLHRLRIFISIATVHADLARRLEARTPVPAARLRALTRLRKTGITAGVLIAPVIPGITDSTADLTLLLAAARRADACFAGAGPLRLGPAARQHFLPHVEREFPRLAERYRRAYARHVEAPAAYRSALKERLQSLKEQFGFRSTEMLEDGSATEVPVQMTML
jgi:DNA repair photolyase